VSFKRVTPRCYFPDVFSGVALSASGRQVQITIGREILNEIGVSFGDRVAIDVGRLTDDGIIQIVKDDFGWKVFPRTNGARGVDEPGAIKVTRRVFRSVRPGYQGVTPCKHSVLPGKDGVMVCLPRWAT